MSVLTSLRKHVLDAVPRPSWVWSHLVACSGLPSPGPVHVLLVLMKLLALTHIHYLGQHCHVNTARSVLTHRLPTINPPFSVQF